MGEAQGNTYVKSPVASLCFACSSVRNRVSVTMFVSIFSISEFLPFVVIVTVWNVCKDISLQRRRR